MSFDNEKFVLESCIAMTMKFYGMLGSSKAISITPQIIS